VRAAVGSLVLSAMGRSALDARGSYLPAGSLLSFWTTISAAGVLASLGAGVAGAVLVATNRTVLTAGVLVALSLVPTAALVGVGLVTLSGEVLRAGALRFGLDVVIVGLTSALVCAWKLRLHQRASTV
jgi:hypothetical protein